MMFEQRWSRKFEVALLISAVVHILLFLLLSHSRPAIEKGFDLQEVTIIDVTYRPEVAKVLSQTRMAGPGGDGEEGAVSTYPSVVAADEVAPLDLSVALARSQSQARIELDRFELARGDEMDVIRIGGKGSAQTTEEILAQAPVSLARGSAGSSAGSGLRGVPGIPQTGVQPQLSIEHRPINKPASSSDAVIPSAVGKSLAVSPGAGPVSTGTTFQVAGPISQREIKKKIKPRYPQWALDRHISGSVTVRIWVEPNGQVKGLPQVLISSGYPDLDQVVVQAVRLWEFAPLRPDVKAEEQWGDITFIFQLS